MKIETARENKQPNWFSESLARGLLVIRAFDAESPRLRAAEIAKRSGISRAAARRYLLTLQALGYVRSDDDRFYLQPKILDLGFAFVSAMQIDRLVQPFLNELSLKTGMSSSFAVLENHDVLFVARASGSKYLQIAVGVGGHVPTHSTSLGHALLSGLTPRELADHLKVLQSRKAIGSDISKLKTSVERVRKYGWALVTDMLADGITGIGAPVRKKDGTVAGAVNIANYGAKNAKSVKVYVPLLIDVVSKLERALQSAERDR